MTQDTATPDESPTVTKPRIPAEAAATTAPSEYAATKNGESPKSGESTKSGQSTKNGESAGESIAPRGQSLTAHNLTLGYSSSRTISTDLTLDIPAGKVTALVGPNACGKSTALRALARLLKPHAGTVHLDGTDISSLSAREFALKLALLPQTPTAPEGITVRDLVARGRTPHQRWWRQWSRDDETVVDAALEATGVATLAERRLEELSGGQRQRVWIAMALAQDAPVLLLDEPTTYLDLAYQVDVLELVADLGRDAGRTVVMVLHELNHACRYADHLIAMRNGQVVASGPPAEIVTAELVQEVFDLQAKVIDCPVTGVPLIVPIGRREV
ncbi:ABC transporter ATP-binding protein [Yinghuangia soli]|uniref:ABC transporter ATP-binding protein n=1 Tax=Yinghuangia soli TaxID=2908204 RepID=A0AA41Q5T8_9ACTN|nr:ABC transporter ATP-binding protein [Yinghuangia soli]MCF2530904.1 ABC transporter ATP-binding protein [Yinghuangia soli]